jgi:hypothetical protein
MVSFDLKRAVVLTAVGAWFVWLTPRTAPSELSPTPHAHVRDLRLAHVAPIVAVESLHDWRPRPVAPMPRARNLFAFGAAAPRRDDAARKLFALTTPPDDVPFAVSPPQAPPFSLVGLAEDPKADQPRRTAVISGGGQLFIVAEGDPVTSRYRVVSISPGTVDLTDLQTGSTFRLAFK